jgi:curli biogenesis system outer membrane secretion channel CsgG
MFKKLFLCVAASSLLLAPVSVMAASKKPSKPTGAERVRQYKAALQGCQKKYGAASADMYVEWGTNYGQTGWWCVSRRN